MQTLYHIAQKEVLLVGMLHNWAVWLRKNYLPMDIEDNSIDIFV